MNRRRLLLAALLGLLALAIISAVVRYPRQKTVDHLTYAPGAVAKPAQPSKLDDRHVHLDLLRAPAQVATEYHRNIFEPFFHPVVKMPPLPPLPKPSLIPPPPPPKPPEAPVVAPPSPTERDLARFTFLGFLVKDKRRTVFLAKDKEIFVVRKGDKILSKYDVVNVTDEALTIKIVSDGSEIVIPLVENRPLFSPRT